MSLAVHPWLFKSMKEGVKADGLSECIVDSNTTCRLIATLIRQVCHCALVQIVYVRRMFDLPIW